MRAQGHGQECYYTADPGLVAASPQGGCTTPSPDWQGGPCDEASWPNKDHDMVCGECKVLVDSFEETYGGHCANYCEALGLSCVAAWEEVGDSCEEASVESCDHHMHGEDGSSISTSDAICQCGPAAPDEGSVVARCAAAGEPRAQLDCLLQPQNAEPIMGGTLVADGGTSTVSGDLSGAAEVGLDLGELLNSQGAHPACAACGTDAQDAYAADRILNRQFALYTFTVETDFALSVSTCSDATNFDSSLLLLRADGTLVVTNDDSVDTCGNCHAGTGLASTRGLGMEIAELLCPNGYLEAGASPPPPLSVSACASLLTLSGNQQGRTTSLWGSPRRWRRGRASSS